MLRCAAVRSGLPDSSEASISTRQRLWLPPLACTASMAAIAANAAYPSSAPPRPYSRSPSRTGIHGPRPSRHPSISGCLSRCPYSTTVDSPAASASPKGWTSATISGVRPARRCTSTVIPTTGRDVIQADSCATAASMWPFSSQRASNDGDSAGMAM